MRIQQKRKRLNSSNQYGLRNDWLLLNKLYFLGYKQTMHDSRDFGSCQISGPQVVQLPTIHSLTLAYLLTWPALCGSETVPQRLFFMLTTSHDQYAINTIWKLFHKLSPVFPALRSSYSGSKRTLSPFPRPLQPRKEEVWQNKSSPPSSGPGRQMTADDGRTGSSFEFLEFHGFFHQLSSVQSVHLVDVDSDRLQDLKDININQ